jgi:DNA-binding response OmpR family regulator
VHVLLVEDDQSVRETLCELLLAAGHIVTQAANFACATIFLQRHPPACDAVLTDLVLPDGSGLDLARRALARGVGAVVCTGHPDQVDRLMREGVGRLVKPFTANDLERALIEAAPRLP